MKDKDLFGLALLDYHEGKRYKLLLERDDGHVDEQSLDIFFENHEGFQYPEKKALEHAVGKVLDLGVGAGRVALHLQELGHEVVGIDVSDHALEVCRRRGVRKAVKMSACDLKFRKNSFDTAIAFCNNFGLCGNMNGVESMLRRLHEIVRPGGVFLASSIHPTRTKNKDHLRYHKLNRARGLPPGQVKLRVRYRGNVGPWWELLMVTPEEMKALCHRTGWRMEKVYLGVMDVYVLKNSRAARARKRGASPQR